MIQQYIYRAICLLIIALIGANTTIAQQLPQFTSITINPYLINPALAGTQDFIHLQAGYRTQWTGFEDAPQTAYFSGHATLNRSAVGSRIPSVTNASRTSVGAVLIHDQTGPLTQNSFAATFAYNFALSNSGWRLSAGLNGGFKSFSYKPEGYTDNLVHQDDATIMSSTNTTVLNLSAGLWLYHDHFFIGASSIQLFDTDYEQLNATGGLTPGSAFLRHYFYMAGIKANLSRDVHLVPSVLVKTVEGAPISYDINAKLVIANQYWMGGSYRKEDSFAVFGGLLIKDRIELTYSFDLVYSKIRNGAASSNEIHIGYRLFHRSQVVCPGKFW